ncbi:MAG: hypothetical protein ABEI86_05665, partial [Halobacteriaceae archaeon]
QAILLAFLAIGVDLIWGVMGQMTFGHAAFFGMGAYIMTGILKASQIGDIGSYLGLIAGTLIPAIAGLIIAAISRYIFSNNCRPVILSRYRTLSNHHHHTRDLDSCNPDRCFLAERPWWI